MSEDTALLTSIIGDPDSSERIDWTMRYLQFYGMFEKRNGSEYSTFNDINKDLYSWKKYEIETDKNSHDI